MKSYILSILLVLAGVLSAQTVRSEEELVFGPSFFKNINIQKTAISASRDASVLSIRLNRQLSVYPDIIPQAPVQGQKEFVGVIKVHFSF
ncbi:MAG: hypothetical protein WCV55_03125 [Candidatus Paceibacterota bacterium]